MSNGKRTVKKSPHRAFQRGNDDVIVTQLQELQGKQVSKRSGCSSNRDTGRAVTVLKSVFMSGRALRHCESTLGIWGIPLQVDIRCCIMTIA